MSLDDLCPRATPPRNRAPEPLSPPLYLSSVYRLSGPDQADALATGQQPGYVYQRDAHPNADLLADKCATLHGAERASMYGSGMAALAGAILALVSSGERVLASDQLYGRSQQLLSAELPRLGITTTQVDTCDLAATQQALEAGARLLIVETISNPLLRVANLDRLAELAHQAGAWLLVDNTFAGPAVCRPLECGADLVMESMTKLLNGHSDVVLGLLCGRAALWERVPTVNSVWGLAAHPFDCWLVERGLATYALRAERACANARTVAQFLETRGEVSAVRYPGLAAHADHALATRQFSHSRAGTIVTFDLRAGRDGLARLLHAAGEIPFCPSLGELQTTLSHPETTSHRGLSADERRRLGILAGTVRLSLGIESAEAIIAALERGLAAAG